MCPNNSGGDYWAIRLLAQTNCNQTRMLNSIYRRLIKSEPMLVFLGCSNAAATAMDLLEFNNGMLSLLVLKVK